MMVELALLVGRSPRVGGGVLTAIFVVAVGFLARDLGEPRIAWGLVQVMLQAALVFGVTGLALLRETNTGGTNL